jgi:hypothetical protein
MPIKQTFASIPESLNPRGELVIEEFDKAYQARSTEAALKRFLKAYGQPSTSRAFEWFLDRAKNG